MKEKYMIVQVKNYFGSQNVLTHYFRIAEKNFNSAESAVEYQKENMTVNPDWYIVMSYWE